MKVTVLVAVLSLIVLVAAAPKRKRNVEERQVAAAVGTFLAPFAKQILGEAVGALTKKIISLFHSNVQDTVLFGRPIRLTKIGNNGIQAKDMDTGLSVTKYDQTEDLAMQAAMNDLFAMLLKMGFISTDDLHIPPKFATTTASPCGNSYPEAYCAQMANQGYCNRGSNMRTFMEQNCGDTCGYCDVNHHHVN